MIVDLFSRPLFWVVVVAAIAIIAVALMAARPQAQAAALSNVSVQQLHAAANDGALVLDVREPFEFAEGRVPGSLLVPLDSVVSRAGEFPKDEPVYVVCRSGNRSLLAARTLAEAGYTDVRNVEGGMIAWAAQRLPVER
jgi:rhodanese-related sulfurtransferase